MIEPFYKDNHIIIHNMDFRENGLPDESIQCVVTSPPYWGLRKYSGEQELIWGDNHCEHEFNIQTAPRRSRTENDCPNSNTISAGSKGSYYNAEGGNTCSLCGAWKGAYGLEPTPEMYIEHTIEILREIRRVLRKDGVVFWNISDSYNGSTPNQTGNHGYKDGRNNRDKRFSVGGVVGLKPKDLCLIPFRVAIAAQEDGWWVRSDIIWSKPNPMPESVTDRPTNSHEHILMLTKSVKYYWDADAVREPHTESTLNRVEYGLKHRHPDNVGIGIPPVDTDRMGERFASPAGRNIRSVWEFPTQPYPEAHFAVFPEKLPEICIKAATPEVGCCSKCGTPWERILDKKASAFNIRVRDAKAGRATPEEGYKATQEEIDGYPGNHPDPGYRQTVGWQPTCKCNADKMPSIVLDPFAGAGTTLWVAKKLNRKAVGYEISGEYCELALERNSQQALNLVEAVK